MPVGISQFDGVPIGLDILGTAWSEPTLISAASAIEDLLQARRPTQFFDYYNRYIQKEPTGIPL